MIIQKVIPLDGAVIRVVAEDGRIGTVDLSCYLDSPAFAPLKSREEFVQVRNGKYFIEWACGADLSADTLESRMKWATSGEEVNIQNARHLGGCRLEITFLDGHVQKIDFKPFLEQAHPELRKYLDEKEFSRFSVEHGNLVWNDYEMCFPIEALYTGKLMVSESELLKVAEDPAEYKTGK